MKVRVMIYAVLGNVVVELGNDRTNSRVYGIPLVMEVVVVQVIESMNLSRRREGRKT